MKRSLVIVLLLFVASVTSSQENSVILLTWDHPTEREDGSALDFIDIEHYTIYYTWNGVERDPIQVPKTAFSYELQTEGVGVYLFSISTTANIGYGPGNTPIFAEGRKSEELRVVLREESAAPKAPGLTGANLSNCNGCGLVQEGAN